MRQFYRTFSNEKVSTLSTQLSWSHYSELLSIKNDDKLSYYLNLSIIQNIGVRELRKKINPKNMKDYQMKQRIKLLKKKNSK